MNSGSEKLLLRALRGEKTGPVPFWFMRQAGRYLPEYREVRNATKDFLSFCYTPDLATEVTLQPLRRFDMSAAIIFSDILVVPHALGMEVWFEQGEGPRLKPIAHHEDVAHLSVGRVEEFLAPVYEAIADTRRALPEDKALIGFAGAPWTLACYMLEGKGSKDFSQCRSVAYQHPELFRALIDLLTEAVIFHLKAQAKAGADALQLFDSWAGLATAEQFDESVLAPAKKISAAIKKEFPHVPVIGFPRMVGALYENYASKSGMDGISIDMQLPLDFACANFPSHVAVQGNLDPYLLAADAGKSLSQARHILEMLKGRPHIFNLGHGILPHTPVAHVEKLCALLHAWKP